MPPPTPNGLLPTLGARGPGFGPGLGPCGFGGTTLPPASCLASSSCAGPGCGLVGGSGDSGCSAFGSGFGSGSGLGPGFGGSGVFDSAVASGLAVAFAPDFEPDFPLPPSLDAPSDFGNASRNRLATGASTVDDADFTNSPCSLSLARTSLLVTPSSFASSCTRALPATALLIW